MRPWLGLAGLVAAIGCGFEPEGAIPYQLPARFAAWWTATEACSERHAALSEVQFFAVPGSQFACPTGQCVGRWEPGHKIYVAERWIGDELVVRHEMLHELTGGGGHPNPPFGRGCPLTWETWPGPSHPRLTETARSID